MADVAVTVHVEREHGNVGGRLRLEQHVSEHQIQCPEQQNAFRVVRRAVQIAAYLNVRSSSHTQHTESLSTTLRLIYNMFFFSRIHSAVNCWLPRWTIRFIAFIFLVAPPRSNAWEARLLSSPWQKKCVGGPIAPNSAQFAHWVKVQTKTNQKIQRKRGRSKIDICWPNIAAKFQIK